MNIIYDDGPWEVSIRKDESVGLQSDDFTHDVFILIEGDFESLEQKIAYARGIAMKLNKVTQ